MNEFNKSFYFHHIGYACNDVEEYKIKFLPLVKDSDYLIYKDLNQNVKVLFLNMIGDYKIELIQVLNHELYCPIKKYIEKNISGFHHVCYESDNINNAENYLSQNGYRLISRTSKGFENRNVSFFVPKTKPDGPLIEIVSMKLNN